MYGVRHSVNILKNNKLGKGLEDGAVTRGGCAGCLFLLCEGVEKIFDSAARTNQKNMTLYMVKEQGGAGHVDSTEFTSRFAER